MEGGASGDAGAGGRDALLSGGRPMSRIIYLAEQPFDARNYDRYGIERWLAAGWSAEVWDITPFAHPAIWANFQESGRALRPWTGHRLITTRDDLDRAFDALGDARFYVDVTGDHLVSLPIKRRLDARGVGRVIHKGAHPLSDEGVPRTLRNRLRQFVSRGIVPALRAALDARMARVLHGGSVPPAVTVISGDRALRLAGEGPGRVVLAHNLDYDQYLPLRASPASRDGAYALFLDQDICFHPDHLYERVPFYATPERYFPALCAFLRGLASRFDLGMRVAAHPRSAYQHKSEDYFQGIPVEYGRTAELISGCEFVVCHFSTAVQFAVLFRKPILFVTTAQIAASSGGHFVRTAAAALGKRAIDLDSDLSHVDWQREMAVDEGWYDAYRREFIKTDGSAERPMWDLVREALEAIPAPPSGA
jgi:hypothetical protein